MHYEPKYDNFHHGPFVMPFISIPTEVTRTHAVRPDEQSPSTTMMAVSSATDFLLGVDTCGFTTSSTSELPLLFITDTLEHELP